MARPATQLKTVKNHPDAIETERHQDHSTTKLKTDIRLLKDMLREEKLKSNRLQTLL
jgi:hypothetical protein